MKLTLDMNAIREDLRLFGTLLFTGGLISGLLEYADILTAGGLMLTGLVLGLVGCLERS